MTEQQSTPPGWYQDPTGATRWWDGTQWGQAAPPAQVPAVAYPQGAGASSWEDQKGLAVLAQVLPIFAGFIGPLIIYLVARDDQRYAKHHAAEALNFSITLFIAYLVCFALMFVLIGFVLIFVVMIGGIVLHVMAAIAASRGEWYRYPINIRMVPGAVG
ncbi:MAG: DUF4870 domain-containing protein [Microthrixaceae bacterium]